MIDIKIIKREFIKYKGHELLAQAQVYSGYFQKLYESMKGRKGEKENKKCVREIGKGKKERGRKGNGRKKIVLRENGGEKNENTSERAKNTSHCNRFLYF